MTVDMDVCCYFLREPQYTRIKDLVRCWMLNLKPDAIPRLVWDEKEDGGPQQEKCFNVAVHLQVEDDILHQTDALFFENLK